VQKIPFGIIEWVVIAINSLSCSISPVRLQG